MEVAGVVEMVYASKESDEWDREGILPCVAFDELASHLPSYASSAFWQAICAGDIPLEVLVHWLRKAHRAGDAQGRNRIVEIIFRRTQASNERWAMSVLRALTLPGGERHAFLYDLCADLYESVLRALLDEKRLFWEENFLHCLYFERKHVYRAFMRREGRWRELDVQKGKRIPRALVASLDQPTRLADGEVLAVDVEDERAANMFHSVEESDLLLLVLRLPDRLKAVVFLIFWEGRSEKEVAHVLAITDRTVRNRLRRAFQLLHDELERGREGMSDG